VTLRPRRLRESLRRDDGSSDALGMALIAPAAIALAIAVLFISRGVDTRATAQTAAEAAAQAAAQERSLGAAQAAAQDVGDAMLVDVTTCANPSVDTITESGFVAGGTVVVTVTCNRKVDDLGLIGPTSDNDARYTAYAVIDTFRAVDP
jgi:Flp pilus assembly protein TadG